MLETNSEEFSDEFRLEKGEEKLLEIRPNVLHGGYMIMIIPIILLVILTLTMSRPINNPNALQYSLAQLLAILLIIGIPIQAIYKSRTEKHILTNKKLYSEFGVINPKYNEISLNSITYIDVIESKLDKLFRLGNIIIAFEEGIYEKESRIKISYINNPWRIMSIISIYTSVKWKCTSGHKIDISKDDFDKYLKNNVTTQWKGLVYSALPGANNRDFDRRCPVCTKKTSYKLKDKVKIESNFKEHLEWYIDPDKPFSNDEGIMAALKYCNEHIYWFDPYFEHDSFVFLHNSLKHNEGNIKEIKILRELKSSEKEEGKIEEVKKDFKKFKEEHKDIDIQMRVTTERKLREQYHDRYIISKQLSNDGKKETRQLIFNIPSGAQIKMNQIAHIYQVKKIPALDKDWNKNKYWNESYDIIENWDKIRDIQKRNIEISKK